MLIGFLLSNCASPKKYKQYPDEPLLYPIGLNDKWGFVDSTSKIKIELNFEEINFFSYGLAAVKQDGKYGYLNKEGGWAIKPKFDQAGNFYYGCAQVKEGEEDVYINRKGKRIEYKDCELSGFIAGCLVPSPPAEPERYSVKKGGKYALTYKQTKDTTEYIFDGVSSFNHDYILVEKDGKTGFHLIYQPRYIEERVYYPGKSKFIYDKVVVKYEKWNDSVIDGSIRFAEVKRNGLWGLIDWKLVEIIEPKYLSMDRILGETLIKVEYEKSKFGCIDYSGNEYFSRKN